jgi:hypothetical protein
MNLLDNTQNQIKNITKTLLDPIKTLLHPSNISYGFIGLTTVLLGYYTFFENNIENPLPDTLASPSESAASQPNTASSETTTASSETTTASSLNPFASSEPSTAASSLNPFASSDSSSEPSSASVSSNTSDEKPMFSGGKKYQRKTNKYKYR